MVDDRAFFLKSLCDKLLKHHILLLDSKRSDMKSFGDPKQIDNVRKRAINTPIVHGGWGCY